MDLEALPWPERPGRGSSASRPAALVGEDRPLHLEGANLYLNRLWLDEVAVAADLRRRAEPLGSEVDDAWLAQGLAALFPVDVDDEDPDHLQPLAAAAAVLRRLSVIAGGPGTGKTTTVARVLALLDAQAARAGGPPPRHRARGTDRQGSGAPRGGRARRGGRTSPSATRPASRLQALRGTTIHRLLGFQPGNRTRFRHHAREPAAP